ncbi:MAG: hypothetical protein WD690_08525 [Vicinamibacterales bacterium]
MGTEITKSPDHQITKSTVAVLLSYGALTLLLAYPVWLRAADHQLGGGNDPWLFIWTIGWNVHALTTAPWAIFDANIFYPHPNTLAYSEHLIGTVLFAAPVVWVTGNQLLATNIVALMSVFLSAVGGFVLGRRLGLSHPAAFIGGAIFAFTPPRFERIDQLHLTTIQWIPFALAYLHGYFQTGRARDLRWAAAFFSLQALTSGHGTAMLTLGGAIVIAHRFATGEPLALAKRIRDIGVPGLLLLAPVALVLIPYLRARNEVGLVRDLDDVGVSASSWVSSASHVDTYLLSLLPDWGWLQTPADVYLFPGILPIALAVAASAVWGRSSEADGAAGSGRYRDRVWQWAALALTIVAISQIALGLLVIINDGVRVRIGRTVLLRAHGWEPWIYAAIAIAGRAALARKVPFAPLASLASVRRRRPSPTPRGVYLLMLLITVWMTIGPPFGVWQWVYWVPGLSFIRVPSRFMLLGMLALAMLSAVGFDRLTARLRASRRVFAAGVLAALLAAEFATMPVDVRPYPIVTPAIDRWLDTQPKPFSVAEFPIPNTPLDAIVARRNLIYMLYSMAHFQPLVQGYSGIAPPGYYELEQKLKLFPDEESARALADLGVTYAAIHMDSFGPEVIEDVKARLERLERAGRLRLVHAAGEEGRVYAIVR